VKLGGPLDSPMLAFPQTRIALLVATFLMAMRPIVAFSTIAHIRDSDSTAQVHVSRKFTSVHGGRVSESGRKGYRFWSEVRAAISASLDALPDEAALPQA